MERLDGRSRSGDVLDQSRLLGFRPPQHVVVPAEHAGRRHFAIRMTQVHAVGVLQVVHGEVGVVAGDFGEIALGGRQTARHRAQ